MSLILFLTSFLLVSEEVDKTNCQLSIYFPNSYGVSELLNTNDKIYLILKIKNSNPTPIKLVDYNTVIFSENDMNEKSNSGVFIELSDSSGNNISHMFVQDDLPPFDELLNNDKNQDELGDNPIFRKKEDQKKTNNEVLINANNTIYDLIDISWLKYHVDTLVKLKLHVTISGITDIKNEKLISNELTIDLRR